jgi:aspartyl-tRNA(Asn)/glutamyl-tRNA(Gln) amidotransferase subunit A
MATVVDTANDVRHGRRSAVEVIHESLSAVERHNDALVAFVHLDWDAALEAAREIDGTVARGEDPGPLAGVPFGVKDLEDCAGQPTSHGSLLSKGSPPSLADDPHVGRLRSAGAVPIGKTATAEFGFGQFTATPAWGVTRNPWRLDRTPGGSSGGSAAAVSAGMVPFATASDGGGSTRDPASFTGLVGHKPTHGRIARPLGMSDIGVKGVLTTTVVDTARVLDVLAGPHPSDKMSLPLPTLSYERSVDTLDVRGLRALWSATLGGHAPVEPEVEQIVGSGAATLVQAAHLELNSAPFRLTANPNSVYGRLSCLSAYRLIHGSGWWPDRLTNLAERTRELAEKGSQMTLEDVFALQEDRTRIERDMARFFADYDILLTPMTPCGAFAAEGPVPPVIGGVNTALGGAEPFGSLANLVWAPAICVPAGLTAEGLPVGLQILVRPHRDEVALRLARILEQVRPWPLLSPLASPRTDF